MAKFIKYACAATYWEHLIKIYRLSDLIQYYAYDSNEGSGETVRVCLLVWAFVNIMFLCGSISIYK